MGLGKVDGLVVRGSVGYDFVVGCHSTCGQIDGCVQLVGRRGVSGGNRVQ